MSTTTTLEERLAEADRLADAALARMRANSRTRILRARQEQEAFVAAIAAQENVMKKAKQQKSAERKAARVPRADLVVFAFRLPKSDRDLIHKAAGPAGASKFVLNAALAAANRTIEKGA